MTEKTPGINYDEAKTAIEAVATFATDEDVDKILDASDALTAVKVLNGIVKEMSNFALIMAMKVIANQKVTDDEMIVVQTYNRMFKIIEEITGKPL